MKQGRDGEGTRQVVGMAFSAQAEGAGFDRDGQRFWSRVSDRAVQRDRGVGWGAPC